MKNFLSKLLVLAIVAVKLVSCSQDDIIKGNLDELTCYDGILNGDEISIDCGGACPGFCPLESTGILEGELVSRLQLDPATEYRLRGPFLVRDKAELSIPAGTVIKADPGIGAYIAVAQGGRVNISGRASSPVIMTSAAENPLPGDWGGLIFCGKGPINSSELGRSDIIDIFYGGQETEDTSGVINFLRVEYAGAEVEGKQKFDAIAFYGVGSFTTITRLQAYKSLGNGIRFIGGNVNAKWLVATENDENGIVLSNDWSGNGDSWFVSGISKAGIEITSNNETGIEDPIMRDTISNVSIIGPVKDGGLNYSGQGDIYSLINVFMTQLDLGFNIDGTAAITQVDSGNLQIDSVQFDGRTTNFTPTNYMGPNTSFFSEATNSGAGNGALKPEWSNGWTVGID